MQGETTVRRYEASPVDTDDVCFTFPIATLPNTNFIVSYYITSDDILVHMNLRSTASNRILRRHRLPRRFKQLYENGENLTEPCEIEFCALSEMSDNADVSTPASAVIYGVEFVLTSSGGHLLILCTVMLLAPVPTNI